MTSNVHDGGQNTLCLQLFVNRDIFDVDVIGQKSRGWYPPPPLGRFRLAKYLGCLRVNIMATISPTITKFQCLDAKMEMLQIQCACSSMTVNQAGASIPPGSWKHSPLGRNHTLKVAGDELPSIPKFEGG